MWRFRKLLLVSLSVTLFISISCNKQKHADFEQVDGVLVKYHLKSDLDKKPLLSEFVTVEMIYRLPDTVLFNSKDEGEEPLVFPMIEPTFEGDLYAGLRFLHVGDSVTFIFPADSFFMVTAGYPELPDFVKPGSDMYFDVKLLKIQTSEEMSAEQRKLFNEMRAQEKLEIEAYIEANNIAVDAKSSGLYVVEEKWGTGRLPRKGDMLRLHFTIEKLDGTQLFSSFGNDPIDVEFGSEFETKGFSEGIGYLRKGGETKLIVPSYLAYDSMGVPQVLPPFTPLIYNLELLDILSLEQVEKERLEKVEAEEAAAEQARINEPLLIEHYMSDQKIDVEPLASGLYYIEQVAGECEAPVEGSTVEVHYTLYNIFGIPLQSSKEIGQTFEFQLGDGQVIRGWEEGILLMRAGGKARLIIPSKLAYGSSKRGNDITPYSPLVFDVELVSVK
jgi:FKBP-type peptidyl-prolyl cis-trans isomerase FkpA